MQSYLAAAADNFCIQATIMAFQFGFANDEGSDDDGAMDTGSGVKSCPVAAAENPVPVKQHTLEELVGMHFSTFPF